MTKIANTTANYSELQEETLTAWADGGKLNIDAIREKLKADAASESPIFGGKTDKMLVAKATNMGIYEGKAKAAKVTGEKRETKETIIADICQIAGLNPNQFDGKQNLLKLREFLLDKIAA